MAISVPSNYRNIQSRIDNLKDGKVQGASADSAGNIEGSAGVSDGANIPMAEGLQNSFDPFKDSLDKLQDSATDNLLNEIPDKEQLCGLLNTLIQDGVDVQNIFNTIRSGVTPLFDEIKETLIEELNTELLAVQNQMLNEALGSNYGTYASRAMTASNIDTSNIASATLASDVVNGMENLDISMLAGQVEDTSNQIEDKITEIGELTLSGIQTMVVSGFTVACSGTVAKYNNIKEDFLSMDACRIWGNLTDMEDFYNQAVEGLAVDSIMSQDPSMSLNDASKLARSIRNQGNTSSEVLGANASSVNTADGIQVDISNARGIVGQA